ncbi:MAG: DUF1836 domain-containing protein [Candidatus Heteroscillospira sp.]|jgi:DNA-binding transcriptional MerR regulator
MDESNMTQREKLAQWTQLMSDHRLPAWSELPDLELYMDQVVSLVNQYLSYTGPMLGEEKAVTPAMINNYVKMGLLKSPVKKRYRRTHLASLVMICILKRTLNMSAIQRLLPGELDEEEVAALYESFRLSRQQGIETMSALVRDWNSELFFDDGDESGKMLVMRLTVMANMLKISAEKLTGAPVESGKKK